MESTCHSCQMLIKFNFVEDILDKVLKYEIL